MCSTTYTMARCMHADEISNYRPTLKTAVSSPDYRRRALSYATITQSSASLRTHDSTQSAKHASGGA